MVCVHILVLVGVEVCVADVDQTQANDCEALVSVGLGKQLCVHLRPVVDLDFVFEDAVFQKKLGEIGRAHV